MADREVVGEVKQQTAGAVEEVEDDEHDSRDTVLQRYFLQEWKLVKTLLDGIVSGGGATDLSSVYKIRSVVCSSSASLLTKNVPGSMNKILDYRLGLCLVLKMMKFLSNYYQTTVSWDVCRLEVVFSFYN